MMMRCQLAETDGRWIEQQQLDKTLHRFLVHCSSNKDLPIRVSSFIYDSKHK